MKRSKIPPHMIRHVRQSGVHGDCVVACLGTLLGLTYEEVLITASKVRPNVLKHGLHWIDCIRIGKKLGMPLKVIKPTAEELEEHTGILGLVRPNANWEAKALKEEHVVYLWAGRVIDGNDEHWLDVEDYLTHYKYEVTGLVVSQEEDS